MGQGSETELSDRVGKGGRHGGREMMEKEVSQPAGEEVRTEAGAGTRWGRGDGESPRASRVPAAALSVHGRG